jgi:hypothetical protein
VPLALPVPGGGWRFVMLKHNLLAFSASSTTSAVGRTITQLDGTKEDPQQQRCWGCGDEGESSSA